MDKRTVKTKNIRDYAFVCRVPIWRIAEELGVSEMTVYRRLRRDEISEEDATEIINAVDAVRHKMDRKTVISAEEE